MQSEYRLLKSIDGKCRFARVTVEAELLEEGIEVTETLLQPTSDTAGEVDREYYADWIDAALRGATLTATTFVQSGQLSGCRVVIRCVMGNLVDTTHSDIICAAALATWQALAPEMQLPAFSFVNSEWQIDFKFF